MKFATTSADFKTIRLTFYIWTYWKEQYEMGSINEESMKLSIQYQLKQTLLHECRHVFLRDNSHNNIPHTPIIPNDLTRKEIVEFKTRAFNLEVKIETGY